jgi:hypothetical protein
MQSWRESTPEHVQEIFDGLFGLSLDFALEMLAKRKEFYPFAFEGTGDEAALVGADPGLGEHPDSQSVLDALYDAGRDRRDEIDALACVSDVRLEDGSDAVLVDLEHREGHSLSIVTPYRRRRLRRSVETDQMSVSTGTARIWA